MVFCNHADHLIPKVPGILRQCLQMQMHYPSASYIVARCQLLPHVLIEPQDGGEPPLYVLEGEGKCQSCLPFPRLGPVMFCGPILSEFCLWASLDLFSPRLAIPLSACLHGSRCVRARCIGGRSLCYRRFLCRSLLSRSCGSSGARLT